jgi:hypothetical protein
MSRKDKLDERQERHEIKKEKWDKAKEEKRHKRDEKREKYAEKREERRLETAEARGIARAARVSFLQKLLRRLFSKGYYMKNQLFHQKVN